MRVFEDFWKISGAMIIYDPVRNHEKLPFLVRIGRKPGVWPDMLRLLETEDIYAFGRTSREAIQRVMGCSALNGGSIDAA